MYDDWGNEIAFSDTAYVPAGEMFVSELSLTGSFVVPDDNAWAADAMDWRFEEQLVIPFSDDRFVIPVAEESLVPKVKPGNDDHWLTPLSTETTVDPITVPPPRYVNTYDSSSPYHSGYNGHDTNQEAYPEQITSNEPDCERVNPVHTIEAPDGARYFVPEGVDGDYLLRAVNHLRDQPDLASRISAFNSMYTDPLNPFFVDFKDWGSEAGPPGSVSGGTIEYWSESLGAYYTGSAFEAFGNYFYGFLGVVGGIPYEILEYAAGFTQTGNNLAERLVGFGMDRPEDKPHVRKGIDDARQSPYNSDYTFGIDTRNCGS